MSSFSSRDTGSRRNLLIDTPLSMLMVPKESEDETHGKKVRGRTPKSEKKIIKEKTPSPNVNLPFKSINLDTYVVDPSKNIPNITTDKDFEEALKDGSCNPASWDVEDVTSFFIVNKLATSSCQLGIVNNMELTGEKLLRLNRETIGMYFSTKATINLNRFITKLRQLEKTFLSKSCSPAAAVTKEETPDPVSPPPLSTFRIPKRRVGQDTPPLTPLDSSPFGTPANSEILEKRRKWTLENVGGATPNNNGYNSYNNTRGRGGVSNRGRGGQSRNQFTRNRHNSQENESWDGTDSSSGRKVNNRDIEAEDDNWDDAPSGHATNKSLQMKPTVLDDDNWDDSSPSSSKIVQDEWDTPAPRSLKNPSAINNDSWDDGPTVNGGNASHTKKEMNPPMVKQISKPPVSSTDDWDDDITPVVSKPISHQKIEDDWEDTPTPTRNVKQNTVSNDDWDDDPVPSFTPKANTINKKVDDDDWDSPGPAATNTNSSSKDLDDWCSTPASNNDNKMSSFKSSSYSGNSSQGRGARGGRGGGLGRGGGGGGGGRSCYNCGQDGHMSRECPTSRKGGSGSKGCFKCGQEGHMSRECPNGSSNNSSGGGGSRKCYKCDQDGHISRDCPTGSSNAGGRKGPIKCFKCNEEGHMSRECPNPNSGSSTGGNRRPVTCYTCKEEGHRNFECPKGDQGSSRRGGRGGTRGRGGHDAVYGRNNNSARNEYSNPSSAQSNNEDFDWGDMSNNVKSNSTAGSKQDDESWDEPSIPSATPKSSKNIPSVGSKSLFRDDGPVAGSKRKAMDEDWDEPEEKQPRVSSGTVIGGFYKCLLTQKEAGKIEDDWDDNPFEKKPATAPLLTKKAGKIEDDWDDSPLDKKPVIAPLDDDDW